MKPFEIDEMCPADVWLYIEGYENRQKQDWERTRVLSYIVGAANADPKKYPKTLEKFMPFSWDEQGKQKLTGAEMLERHRQLKKQNK